jgi:hypothetical protein
VPSPDGADLIDEAVVARLQAVAHEGDGEGCGVTSASRGASRLRPPGGPAARTHKRSTPARTTPRPRSREDPPAGLIAAAVARGRWAEPTSAPRIPQGGSRGGRHGHMTKVGWRGDGWGCTVLVCLLVRGRRPLAGPTRPERVDGPRLGAGAPVGRGWSRGRVGEEEAGAREPSRGCGSRGPRTNSAGAAPERVAFLCPLCRITRR